MSLKLGPVGCYHVCLLGWNAGFLRHSVWRLDFALVSGQWLCDCRYPLGVHALSLFLSSSALDPEAVLELLLAVSFLGSGAAFWRFRATRHASLYALAPG